MELEAQMQRDALAAAVADISDTSGYGADTPLLSLPGGCFHRGHARA
jgi:hypothetical protein